MTFTPISAATMPILALRGLTVFPRMLLQFDVARPKSVQALDYAMEVGGPIFLIPQRDLAVEDPQGKDLYNIGVICTIRQLLRLPGGSVRALVEGMDRGHILRLTETEPYLRGEIECIPPIQMGNSPRVEALRRQSYAIYQRYAELAPTSPETLLSVLSSDDPGEIADAIAQNSSMRLEDKQAILEELRPRMRLERLCRLLRRETEILELENDVENKVRQGLDRTQREYYLRQQLKVIEEELGEGEDSELTEYRTLIQEAKLPKEVEERLFKELERLGKQPYASAEASVSRNYLDVCLELPWGKTTKERLDVSATRRALDKDHYGLEKVKERILEYVAVRRMAPEQKGQILCLVGRAGGGEDVDRSVRGKGLEPQAGPDISGRHSRRGGGPGPPQDLCRSHARPDHCRAPSGGVLQPRDGPGRDRQAGARRTERSVLRSFRGAGPGTKRVLPGPLFGASL